MSELVIQPFTIQPLIAARDGSAILRWAYNRPFLDSDNVQVQWGTQSTGFGINVPCSIASGLVSIDQDTTLWTTDNAQDTSPLTILISAWLLTSQGKLIQQLQIAGKPQWVVPSSQVPTTTWNEFSNYNQAVSLYYYNPNFYNAPQVDAQIREFAQTNYASDTHLGGVFTSITPAQPTEPVAWITDDPLVRDAIKIQSIDVTAIPPTDGMALVFSQALDSYTPTIVGPTSGNVTSNEVSSVDGQVTLASGTDGKTIKFSTIIDDGTSFDATGMRIVAAEYDSDSASIADNGTIRLNKDDFIAWRNEVDGGNIILDKNASDQIASSGGFAGTLAGNVTGNVAGNVTGNLTGLVNGQKKYAALLTQTSTNAPVATVLQNDLGGTVVWTRVSPGKYQGTLAGAFAAAKTVILMAANFSSIVVFALPTQLNTDIIEINAAVMDVTTDFVSTINLISIPTDGILTATGIEITVYP